MNPYICFGTFNRETAGHPEGYFSERYSWLDFRGGLFIDPTAQFGFGNRIITASHSIATGEMAGPAISKPVTIGAHAWITSFCVLYNCTIGHHAVVSIGSVVANMTVEPYTIVAGNPARAVAKWDLEAGKWVRL